jgi:hypothetical protein
MTKLVAQTCLIRQPSRTFTWLHPTLEQTTPSLATTGLEMMQLNAKAENKNQRTSCDILEIPFFAL